MCHFSNTLFFLFRQRRTEAVPSTSRGVRGVPTNKGARGKGRAVSGGSPRSSCPITSSSSSIIIISSNSSCTSPTTLHYWTQHCWKTEVPGMWTQNTTKMFHVRCCPLPSAFKGLLQHMAWRSELIDHLMMTLYIFFSLQVVFLSFLFMLYVCFFFF